MGLGEHAQISGGVSCAIAGSYGGTIQMGQTKIRRRSHGDKTRRGRWLDEVHASGVSRGAVAWAVALSRHPNATAKPVYGLQTGQAAEIRCSDRQVRRYRRE